ncbi:MAG: CYTH domain-containing protein [Spirochaetales bacterium]|nr:CYTH domain-containing protein [Spirochaetales bacterium]
MAKEIEKKYLVTSDGYTQNAKKEHLVQGYLCLEPSKAVRVRMGGGKAFLTIKTLADPEKTLMTRNEFEYEIPMADGEKLLSMCIGSVIKKNRYTVECKGHVWEVDVFEGANKGLVVAEIELSAEDEPFDKPDWVGPDVTEDRRFLNVALALNPYTAWKD